MNHSSVSADPQPSSANVVMHLITIHNDDNDVIQQSFSPVSALKSSHYPLQFQVISLMSDQPPTSEHIIVLSSSSNSEI